MPEDCNALGGGKAHVGCSQRNDNILPTPSSYDFFPNYFTNY